MQTRDMRLRISDRSAASARPTTIKAAVAIISIMVAAATALAPVTGQAATTLPALGRIHARAQADVTGDGIDDSIALVGHPYSDEGLFCTSHDIVVNDAATGEQITMALGERGAGYPGTLFVGRIDGDNALDVVVAIPTGGSGGIVNLFVTSFAGGKARHIVDSDALARGAELKVSALDHFMVEVVDSERQNEFTLGLAGPGSDTDPELDYYNGIYSKSGALIRPLDIGVDAVGAVEALSIGKTGRNELVTYQKVWAVAHANSIGCVRTVWRWTGRQLAIASVDVTPLFGPDAYGRYIASFDKSQPAAAVEKALAEYEARFRLAPPYVREAAFCEFRQFHTALAAQEAASLEQRAGLADAPEPDETAAAYARLPELASKLNTSRDYKRAGINAVYDGEGMWTVVPRPGFTAEQFGQLLPPSAADFVRLDDRERNERWQYDAAIVAPLGELGSRVAAWEAYLAKYPDSVFADDARTHFERALSALLLGTPNTPHFDCDTRRVRADAVEALKAYAKNYPGTPSAEAVASALKAIEKGGNVITEAIRREINRAIDKAVRTHAHLV